MKHLTALILATLALGNSVMARDTNYQAERPPLHGEKSPMDVLQETERGRELKNIVDMTLSGDKEGAEKAYEAYRKKYNPPPMGSYPGAQEQARPRPQYDFGPPMMLPPEAR